jgi:hypothetical protein
MENDWQPELVSHGVTTLRTGVMEDEEMHTENQTKVLSSSRQVAGCLKNQ